MKKLLIVLLAITMASCNPCKRIIKKSDKHDCIDFDTTYIETVHDTVIYRDTTIYIRVPKDTIRDTLTLQVHQNKIEDVHKVFKSTYMTIEVDIVNNVMSIDATINEKKFAVTIKGAIVKVIKDRKLLQKVVVTKKVNELTKWQKILIALGWIMVGCVVVSVVVIVVNLKKKILG